MKRTISLLLVLVMIIGLLPVGASAATGMKASSKIMEYIKSKEGCKLTAYRLEGEKYYTIGYGHYGPDVGKDQKITQTEANKLFSDDLKAYENAVNSYNTKYDLKLTQNQFDALVSFTYNLGTNWPNNSWRLAAYMKNGFKFENGKAVPELEIADAFGVISNGGAGLMPGLIVRRIEEAKIFLYGDYDGTGSRDFVYAILDPDGGTLTSGNRVAIYFKGQPYGTLPEVKKSGYYLTGWKSASGYVTTATIAAKNQTLTAVWESGDAQKTYELTVKDGSGSGSYNPGEKVFVGQISKPGYCFTGWKTDGVATTYDLASGGYYIIMPARNVTLTALYQEGCIFGNNCPSKEFRDIDPLSWAHEGIDFCVSNKILTGTSTDTFSPDDPMTRGMAVTALYRNAGSPSVKGIKNTFSDTEYTYYSNAVLWALKNDIYRDEGFGLFEGERIISREEFAQLLYSYAGYLGCDTRIAASDVLSAFSDGSTTNEAYRQAMEWCVAKKIIIGTDEGTLEPEMGATRAQIATMLLRFMQVCVSF